MEQSPHVGGDSSSQAFESMDENLVSSIFKSGSNRTLNGAISYDETFPFLWGYIHCTSYDDHNGSDETFMMAWGSIWSTPVQSRLDNLKKIL